MFQNFPFPTILLLTYSKWFSKQNKTKQNKPENQVEKSL